MRHGNIVCVELGRCRRVDLPKSDLADSRLILPALGLAEFVDFSLATFEDTLFCMRLHSHPKTSSTGIHSACLYLFSGHVLWVATQTPGKPACLSCWSHTPSQVRFHRKLHLLPWSGTRQRRHKKAPKRSLFVKGSWTIGSYGILGKPRARFGESSQLEPS